MIFWKQHSKNYINISQQISQQSSKQCERNK
jgi:hypothetical protein